MPRTEEQRQERRRQVATTQIGDHLDRAAHLLREAGWNWLRTTPTDTLIADLGEVKREIDRAIARAKGLREIDEPSDTEIDPVITAIDGRP